jgi:hypothetical protein
MVVSNLRKSLVVAKKALRHAITNLPPDKTCVCSHALENAIITDPKLITDKIKTDLGIIISKYIR